MKTKILCLLMCFVMLVSGLIFADFTALTAYAATRGELEDRIDELDDQIADNKNKLNELKGKKEKQKEYLETLENQIEAVEEKARSIQTQMGVIDGEIEKLDTQLKQLRKEIKIIQGDIELTQQEITATEADIAASSDNLAARLRASYVKGSESTLKILMGSDSLASFMTRLELMRRTSEEDKRTITEFKEKAVKLKKQKNKLEKDEKELEEKSSEITLKKDEKQSKREELAVKEKEFDKTTKSLEKQYAEIETYIGELDKSGNVYQNYINQLQAEKASADAEIDRILSQWYATSVKETTTLPVGGNAEPTTQGSGGGASGGAGPNYTGGGSWAWPLGNASCYISSHYGYRDASISGWSFHGGTDITGGGIYGKPVYATRAGKVISAVTSNSGYGIYVMIDHGDGYSSMYAHMSARYVSTGDYVTKGQQIGRVGSSGNSTGPHLHFEIRYYGEKKNPMNFVRKP